MVLLNCSKNLCAALSETPCGLCSTGFNVVDDLTVGIDAPLYLRFATANG